MAWIKQTRRCCCRGRCRTDNMCWWSEHLHQTFKTFNFRQRFELFLINFHWQIFTPSLSLAHTNSIYAILFCKNILKMFAFFHFLSIITHFFFCVTLQQIFRLHTHSKCSRFQIICFTKERNEKLNKTAKRKNQSWRDIKTCYTELARNRFFSVCCCTSIGNRYINFSFFASFTAYAKQIYFNCNIEIRKRGKQKARGDVMHVYWKLFFVFWHKHFFLSHVDHEIFKFSF